MPFTPANAALEEVGPQKPDRWRLTIQLKYTAEGTAPIVVPGGWVTDLASVPRILTWLIPRYGLYTKAAIVHDYLCRTAPDRFQADQIFRLAMAELGVPWLRRWLMWAAVTWVTILGQLQRRLLLTLLAVAILAVLAVAYEPLEIFGVGYGATILAALTLAVVAVICLIATERRPLLPSLLACYLVTPLGFPALIASVPALVLLGVYLVVDSPVRSLLGLLQWVGNLLEGLRVSAQAEARRYFPALPVPSPTLSGETPRALRMRHLLLDD